MDNLSNSWILGDPGTLQNDDFLMDNPQYMKQRSDLWMDYCKGFQLTGSTIYNALGLRTLKDQKIHYQKYVKKEDIQQETTPVMQHRIDHEVSSA